jgi:hypothetical protein
VYQVCISFDPEGPQYSDQFDDMAEAFSAFSQATDGLPARVAVFCFQQDGEEWKPLLKRVNSAYKKRLKEVQGSNGAE